MAAGKPEPSWMNPAWRATLGLPEAPPPPELLEAIRTGNGPCLRGNDDLTPAQARAKAGRDLEPLGRYEAEQAEAPAG